MWCYLNNFRSLQSLLSFDISVQYIWSFCNIYGLSVLIKSNASLARIIQIFQLYMILLDEKVRCVSRTEANSRLLP